MRKVILNADDFCLSPVFNEVILQLLQEGALTSTTVMVDRYEDDQSEQLQRLKSLADIGVGLHVELASNDDIEKNVQQQFSRFVDLFGQEPDHLDLHKHDFETEGYPVIVDFCRARNLPQRNNGSTVISKSTTVPAISAIQNSLDFIVTQISDMDSDASVEIVLHPGNFDPKSVSSLNHERVVDATKAKYVADHCRQRNIQLISFGDL